ncbi:CD180 antigen-like [Diabrotica undecimpunctata]|uniref:CD180 antigen-like n=1 Tax=Diabrotica undecimpunctata TaxID=50387 RepID=UPI003B63422B
MEKWLIILLYIIHFVTAEETYQNSSNICARCKCNSKDEFLLDCTNQKFEYVLANWPPHNQSLVATFSYNNITTLERLPATNHTAKLVFDHCRIKYLEGGVFSLIENVEYIDLSHNLLTTEEISGDDFRGPYSNKQYRPIAVKTLNLAYNQIHSLHPKFFENMPLLEDLYLQGNDFTVLDPSTQVALGSLTNIKVLNLADNELTVIEENVMRNVHSLQNLDLSSNHFDFVPKPLSYISKNLQILNLGNNYIFQLTDESFLGMNLSELYLNNLPRLKFVGANTFATLRGLKKLHLRDNQQLEFIDKEAFGENQIIDELDISNNSLVDLDPGLMKWSKLKIFKVNLNPLVCSCSLYNISQALPKSITRNRNSPMCKDVGNDDGSERIYSLTADICNPDRQSHTSILTQHFNKIRVVMIILSSTILVVTVIAAVIGVLRYRKSIAFKNYPFSAQVSYFPVQTQHI